MYVCVCAMKRSVTRGVVMRKMSWIMDWKWMKYELVRRLWEMCGGGCGRCVKEAVGDA